jgi:hypothetical protein
MSAGLSYPPSFPHASTCQFSCFDEYWQRFQVGEGPSGSYVAGLPEDHRQRLKEQLRVDVLRGGSDGPFTLQAKAWAVRGIVRV